MKTLLTTTAALALFAPAVAFADSHSTKEAMDADCMPKAEGADTDTAVIDECDVERAAENTEEAVEEVAQDAEQATENAAEEVAEGAQEVEDGAEELAEDADAAVDEATEEVAEGAEAVEKDLQDVADSDATDGTEIAPALASTDEMRKAPQSFELADGSSLDLTAEELIGEDVIDANGDDIGEVSDILFTTEGSIEAAIIDVGGFLGLGEHTVAVPMDKLSFEHDEGLLDDWSMRVSLTQEELEALDEYEAD